MPTETIGPKSLVKKLVEISEKSGYVQKRGYNKFHKYNYVLEADLLEMIKPELLKRNIVMIPSVVDERCIGTEQGNLCCLTLRVTFYDGDSGETLSFNSIGYGLDTGDKGAYKAQTGAMKYALMKAFNVSTGEEPEDEDREYTQVPTRAAVPKVDHTPAKGVDAPRPGEKKVKPEENVHGVEITDDDIPENIGNVPTPEERKEHAKKLKGYKVDTEALKMFIFKSTGVEDSKKITALQWKNVFAKLDEAQKAGKLTELLEA